MTLLKELERYLKNGPQTTLTSHNIQLLEKYIKGNTDLLNLINQVIFFKLHYLKNRPTKEYEGKRTVTDLLKERILTGCHDHAIVVASALRHFGYPVVMLLTVDISWLSRYLSVRQSEFNGHVFLEIFYQNRWILLDSTSGDIFLDYNRNNPIIATKHQSYLALRRGLDPFDYGVKTIEDLERIMKEFIKKHGIDDMYEPQHISKLV